MAKTPSRSVVILALICNLIAPAFIFAQTTNTNTAADTDTITNTDLSTDADEVWPRRRHRGVHRDAVVVFGDNVLLKENETAQAVVVIGGSATIKGHVDEAVVVIGGDITIEGEIGDAAVAVLGSVRAGQGARIGGDIVAVGGTIDLAEGAKVRGESHEVNFGGRIPWKIDWLKKWFIQCVLKLRPLAPSVGWIWGIWAVFLLVYLLVAAVFPTPVRACVEEITRRPATTFLMGILTKLLLPIVIFLLVATVVGTFVVPFLFAALLIGFVIGKVAIFQSLGFQIGRQFGGAGLKSLAAFLVGAIIITLLYIVPVLGLLTFGIISVWGLGAAVMAAFGGFRREMPAKPSAPPVPPASIPPVAPLMPSMPASAGASFATTPPQQDLVSAAPPANEPSNASTFSGSAPAPASVPSAAAPTPVLPDAWAFPKASFWERMGAAFLDIVLVGLLGALVHRPVFSFLVTLAYFSGMWAWKGTTIGGIVLGTKVARLDGQQLSFTVTLVRALAAFFSVIVFFLGILWIIWDKDKQAWHDKIAGTVVVKLPRGAPLVCL